MKRLITSCVVVLIAASSASADLYDQNVTNNVIFGSGNANGSFTVDRDNGVELGLRGKLRHNAAGAAENTFNSNGDGTYTFNAGVAPTQSSPTAVWSFEWSINTDYDGTTGWNLADLTYEFSMNSTNGNTFNPVIGNPFDVINGINPGTGTVYWDHAQGDNSTANGAGAVAVDETDYANMIATNSLAQNSWKIHWFADPSFDPTLAGDYTFNLRALDGNTEVANVSMVVQVIPEPTTLSVIGLAGVACVFRRRRSS